LATNSFYRILQVTLSNARDICLSDYIFSVEAFRATAKLLLLLSLVWLTRKQLKLFLNINKVTGCKIKNQDHVIGQKKQIYNVVKKVFERLVSYYGDKWRKARKKKLSNFVVLDHTYNTRETLLKITF